MRATIRGLVLVAAGCEWFQGKPPLFRCESVPAAASAVSKERQAKLDELADLQLDIDLAIAREDQENVELAENLRALLSYHHLRQVPVLLQ
jgi:hypothetical protein